METLLLSRSDVERLLTPDACIAAVEQAFRLHALGEVPPPGILASHAGDGSFHAKAALLSVERAYFAAGATVVTDLTEQACAIGELHHAIAAGIMSRDAVHAELGEIVAGRKAGRTSDAEIIVFDSTGTGLQDVAAAAATYRRALEEQPGRRILFNNPDGGHRSCATS